MDKVVPEKRQTGRSGINFVTALLVAGVPVRELSRRTGVSHSTAARLLRLEQTPTLDLADRVAAGLGTTLARMVSYMGQGQTGPCGHFLGLPGPGSFVVTCRDCKRKYEWLTMEVGQ